MDKFKKIVGDVLEDLGDDIVKDARILLKARKKDKNSSGNLSRSLTSSVTDTTLTIYGADYANYVDTGTSKMSGNEYLTDAVDNNINEYGNKIVEAIDKNFQIQVDIIIK